MTSKKKRKNAGKKNAPEEQAGAEKPDGDGCVVCGGKPTVAHTGLCGPCCFGEADTAGGNW